MDTAACLVPEWLTERMLRLKDVLELPVVRRALPEVIAGAEALDRELRWAHVVEIADPTDLLKGGELVLTTGIGAGARERDQARWIASVVEQGAAAVAVELGSTWREHVPEPVVRACAGRRAAGRVPPLGALRRDHRGGARGGAQQPVRAAAPRRGDPSPLHRADPARPRRAGDPRRADGGGRQPGRARGRRSRARLLRVRPVGRRRGAGGVGRHAPRGGPRRGARGRARWSTCG